jgi:hypothetical protein
MSDIIRSPEEEEIINYENNIGRLNSLNNEYKYLVNPGAMLENESFFVKSENVTTSFVGGYKSSCLTNPRNIRGKFYYFPKNPHTHRFEKLDAKELMIKKSINF